MDNNTSSSGIGFWEVLTIVFVVLKLVGVINWSWWWVLSPILIGIGLSLVFIIIYAICITHEDTKYDLTYTKRRKDRWKF